MKLNKYLFSTFIAASALLISSCSDFLDRSPQGPVSYTHLTLPTNSRV